MVSWAAQLTDADLEERRYSLCDFSKNVELVGWSNLRYTTEPSINYYEQKMYGKVHAELS